MNLEMIKWRKCEAGCQGHQASQVSEWVWILLDGAGAGGDGDGDGGCKVLACLLACLHAYMHLSLSLSLMRAYFRLRLCLCHHHHKSNLFIFIVFFRLSVRLSCPLAGEVTFPCLPILYSFALVLSFSANLNLATLEGREGPWDLGAKFTHSGAQKPSPLYPPPSPTTHQCNKE